MTYWQATMPMQVLAPKNVAICDELVRPVTNPGLRDGATNTLIQSQCPARIVGHVGLGLDGTVYDGVHDALRGTAVSLDCWAL